MTRAVVVLAALLALGCNELTEIIVVVNSDLAVPTELDAVRVEVTGSQTMTAAGSLTGSGALPLPRTVGIARGGGALGPLTIRVVGSRSGVDQVERTVVTSFRAGHTLVLPITLSRSCVRQGCAEGETCRDGACVSNEVSSSSLAEWGGSVPAFDAGGCRPAAETCDGTDEDCDGRIDESFDFTSNVSHCGGCGRVCMVPNASSTCVGGVCGTGACNAGFGDCDADPSNGCEASLATVTDCGACGTVCTVAAGTGDCSSGTCAVGSCDPGLGDCNLDPSDGCEAMVSTLTDCGACGVACDLTNATATCATGACEIDTCDAGFDDCNMDPSDGCETPLDTLTDCGACGVACTIVDGTGSCATGTCEVATCASDRGDCNMDPSDGCETNTRDTDAHCGMCGMACLASEMCRNSRCI